MMKKLQELYRNLTKIQLVILFYINSLNERNLIARINPQILMENAEPLGALKELENLGLIEQIKYTNDKAELTLTPMGGRMIPYHLIQTTHISVNEVKLFLYETKYVYKR